MNRTVDDVESIAELTTGSQHDPELYSLTVSEALDESRPFVVVFAALRFAQTPYAVRRWKLRRPFVKITETGRRSFTWIFTTTRTKSRATCPSQWFRLSWKEWGLVSQE